MKKKHVFTILSFLALLVLLQFGFKTKPDRLIQEEKTRSLNLQVTSIDILRDEARQNLGSAERSFIQILETRLDNASDTLERIEILKELSRNWYEAESFSVAGAYAEEIAILNEEPGAWGIAGTTYAYGIERSDQEKERTFCLNKSIECLENAISLDPGNVEYQLNRAILLTEHPPGDNPMKGILLLRELNKNFPKNVPVMNNLARFALQTNQVDRALTRLLEAESLEPNNRTTNCLLAQTYQALEDQEKTAIYQDRCNRLN